MSSILLVDDTGLFRSASEDIERRTHCRALRASNGTDAIAAARRDKPDLIFLDADMNGMTGVDVCRVLKADSHMSKTPVVVAAANEAAQRAAGRAGADACLAKPFDDEILLESVRAALAR